MITMNRLYCLDSEKRSLLAHLDESDLGFHFMHSSIGKQKQGNCLDIGYR